MTTGIIILNFNNSEDTIQCIRSIEEHNTAPVKYIIVDNGSRKDSVDSLRRFLEDYYGNQLELLEEGCTTQSLAHINFLASPTNDGYARGNNKGLAYAFADPDITDIVILNNDILFESDIIPVLMKEREKLERPAILTPLLRNRNGSVEMPCARRFPTNWQTILPFLLFKHDICNIISKSDRKQRYFATNPELTGTDAFPIGMPSGAFMFVDKQLFQSINGFDNGTFLYYEENILCRRLQGLGYKNYCIPKVYARHIGGASTSKISNLFLQKCNLESADYYLKNYAQLNIIQKLIWGIVRFLWILKFKLKANGEKTA